jgi:hypothetical protein
VTDQERIAASLTPLAAGAVALPAALVSRGLRVDALAPAIDSNVQPPNVREIHAYLQTSGYLKLVTIRSTLRALERDRVIERIVGAKVATVWKRRRAA